MKKNTSFTKSELTLAVQTLLQEHAVGTQEDICALLNKSGFNVNQTRVSRILHQLGAVKHNEQGKITYRLMPEISSMSIKHSLRESIISIKKNEVCIVIHTLPGSAQLIASLLDHQKEIGILGTVAGDDTIIIAPQSIKNIASLLKKIATLLIG